MNISQIVVQGILQADGTLLLNEMPNLPAGPVEVFIFAANRQQTQMLNRGGSS